MQILQRIVKCVCWQYLILNALFSTGQQFKIYDSKTFPVRMKISCCFTKIVLPVPNLTAGLKRWLNQRQLLNFQNYDPFVIFCRFNKLLSQSNSLFFAFDFYTVAIEIFQKNFTKTTKRMDISRNPVASDRIMRTFHLQRNVRVTLLTGGNAFLLVKHNRQCIYLVYLVHICGVSLCPQVIRSLFQQCVNQFFLPTTHSCFKPSLHYGDHGANHKT